MVIWKICRCVYKVFKVINCLNISGELLFYHAVSFFLCCFDILESVVCGLPFFLWIPLEHCYRWTPFRVLLETLVLGRSVSKGADVDWYWVKSMFLVHWK